MAGTMLVAAPIDDADAAAGDRALTLVNVHTNEGGTIVFKRNGRYDPAGLKKLNVVLRDWRRNQPTNMDPRLFDLIWEVYRQSGSRVPIKVVCGYRSPETNGMLRARSRGVAKHSQHMLGKAMDFYIPDVPLAKLRAIGLRMQVGGVGFYPTSGSPFVHMDTGSVRHWPKMTREQLVRIFPDGKTLHIPSDGRPLPGYEQALAAYKARKASGGEIIMASAAPAGGGGKSWLSKIFGGGGGADEAEDNSDVAAPAAKAPRAVAVAAADAGDDAADVPAKMIKPTAKPETAQDDNAKPDAAPAPEAAPVVVAMAPVPRPSPIPHDAQAADDKAADDKSAETVAVAEAIIPPVPRASPVVRPQVALASASGTAPIGRAASQQLAALQPAAPVVDDNAPKTAADAIADAVGDRNNDSGAMLAYAPAEDNGPHIDANTGAIVAGLAVNKARSSGAASTESNNDWQDPLARLSPVGYSSDTIELVMRAGSTRQIGYAEMEMPHPFGVPELFVAPERSVRLGFGRVAYEGLRTDRFSGPLVRPLGTMEFASNAAYSQTAYLKR